ncbi:MAG: UDP-N-acetylmuramate dehydrogenase [Treponema sp.]|nr:UDP-N-acetylmuramate dehydrogenase [Treponema sp.]
MNKYGKIIEILKNHEAFIGDVLTDEPLAPKTTFKVGGNAELFIAPQNYYSFQIALDALLKNDIPFFIMGGGSNLVFSDDGFKGAVVSTCNFNDTAYYPLSNMSPQFGKVTLKKNELLITCFSGTPMAAFVNFCTENNISGVEQFAGLPGTVGGAVFMNARCFDKSISDIIFSVSYMDIDSKSKQIKLNQERFNPSEWAYKKSPYQDGRKFITTATFLLTQKKASENEQIVAECKKYINERVSKGHFKFPSAGSVFKNNHAFGKPSGQIIDEAGLRGTAIGGAKVADFHGNFIINTGNAKASEIKALVELVQDKVKQNFGFSLEPEIIFVDN